MDSMCLYLNNINKSIFVKYIFTLYLVNINTALLLLFVAFATNNYWSSSEYSSNNAWKQNFNNGNQNNNNKNNTNKVRAVRVLKHNYFFCKGFA